MESMDDLVERHGPKYDNYDGCYQLTKVTPVMREVRQGAYPETNFEMTMNGNHLAEQIDYYNNHGDAGIRLEVMSELCYANNDLNFLETINVLNRIYIQFSHEIKDLSLLFDRTELEYLILGEVAKYFDFSRLINLQHFLGSFPHKFDGFESCTMLKAISAGKYKPKSKDLSMFSSFPKLRELELIQSNVESLEGLVGSNKLKKFELHYCRKISDLNGFKTFGRSLEVIRFGSCPKIYDLDLIGEYCPNLKELLITRFRTIKDLDFVRKLPKLERILLMDGTVESLDLTPCLDLKNLKTFHIDNKRVYDVHPREIAKQLGVKSHSKR